MYMHNFIRWTKGMLVSLLLSTFPPYTFNWFDSKFHWYWLFTAFVLQISTESSRPWWVYDKRVQSGEEVPVPQRAVSQRNLFVSNMGRKKALPTRQLKNSVAQFKTGYFSSEAEQRPGMTLAMLENVDAPHSMVLADHRIAAKKIADTLEISQECVGFNVHDVLDIMKLSAKWEPKWLNVD